MLGSGSKEENRGLRQGLSRWPALFETLRRSRRRTLDFYPIRVRRRRSFAHRYYREALANIHQWARLRTEADNFYYELSHLNRIQLCGLLAVVTGVERITIEDFITELAKDAGLRSHLETVLKRDRSMRDTQVAYGRREGWYALIRVLKPRLVIETGVHHGVGACVISSALMRNESEGYPGRYLGIDIDPGAGRCFTDPYSRMGRVAFEDSLTTLSNVSGPVDMFINDSDHSAEYEAKEYKAIAEKLSPHGIIIGDNSHSSVALADFSLAAKREFVFFREQPQDHWYPGAGIGLSVATVPAASG